MPQPTGACEAIAGDHAASCPADACPIVVDVEIVCEGEFGRESRIVADEAQTFVVTNGSAGVWLLGIDAAAAMTVETLPAGWTEPEIAKSGETMVLATHVIVDDESEGVRALVREGDEWSESSVFPGDDKVKRFMDVVDIAVVDGEPRLWFDSAPLDNIYSRAMRDDSGTWQVTEESIPSEYDFYEPRFRSVDGVSTRFILGSGSGLGRTIATSTGGALFFWPGPASGRSWEDYELPPEVDLRADDLPLPVALADEEVLAVAWGPDAGAAIEVPDLAVLSNECTGTMEAPCRPCEIEASGTGGLYGDFAIARTDDGVAWLVATVTHLDESWSYEEAEDGPCSGDPVDRGSTGELVIHRIDGVDASPELVFSLPIEAPYASLYEGVPVSTAGNELAIVMRVFTEGRDADASKLRMVRLDTSRISSP